MSQLNDSQLKAVNHKTGPALVVAGAGTGKTRVITERIAKLIEDGAEPESIIALTFTEKATAEMVDRVNELRGGYNFDVQIATFNAFGEGILRRFATDIGMHSNLRVLNDISQIVFMRDNLNKLGLDYYSPVTNPDGMLGDLARYFSQLKQNVVSDQQYKDFIDGLPEKNEAEKLEKARHLELASAYKKYRDICKVNNVIDYDDQIYLTIELLKTRPNISSRLKGEIKHILVDEFQDTNAMQAELLKLILNDEQNIMVVGDDDQSIYGFRGANLNNILDFKDVYKDTFEVVLDQNYRSSQAILDASYKLIENNNPHRLEVKNNLNKKLEAQFDGDAPNIQTFATFESEIQSVAEQVNQDVIDGVSPHEIAVLTRRNTTALKVHEALDYQGIENQLAGQTHDLYREPIIRSLVNVLETINNPLDSKGLFHTLSGPFFKHSANELSEIAASSRREHVELYEALSETESVKSSLEKIDSWREAAATTGVGELCYQIITETGLKDELAQQAEENEISAKKVLYLSQFFKQLKDFENSSSQNHLSAYLETKDLLAASSQNLNDDLTAELDRGVAVLTIHKSKGLEWEKVYLIDVSEGSLPSRNRSSSLEIPEELKSSADESGEQTREERRLMYVAMTRAKNLYRLATAEITAASRLKKPSRFIFEIEPNFKEAEPSQQIENNQKLVDPAPNFKLPKTMIDGEVLSMSVSQLNDYLRCPYDFYYRHILMVPLRPSATLDFGTHMHNVIEVFNRNKKDGKETEPQQLKDEFRSTIPKHGFADKEQWQRMLDQADSTIDKFIERQSSNTAASLIEQPFVIRMDGSIQIKGRFDAVFEGDQTEIVDYKTGTTATTPEKAKRRARSSTQLTLYALAWQQMKGELPDKLSLDFVETGQIGSVKKTQRSIDTATSKIQEAVDQIKAGVFPPGQDHTYCEHN